MHLSRFFIPLLTAGLVFPATLPCIAAPNDHELITGPFANIQAVTAQCLGCHAQQGADILQSSHWTWQRSRRIDSTIQTFAKKSGLTTFAIGVETNSSRCLTCHISTNLLGGSHDPTSAAHIDCLVCHDTTGTYRRTFGTPKNDLDLGRIARNAGKPQPGNCLTCHGKDCGLTNLSGHGGFTDDVHLKNADGGLTCQQCHPSEGKHSFPRQLIATGGSEKTTTGCSACHTDAPHARKQLNQHTKTVGCQTCHIPVYGRSTPALISWNWLTQPSMDIYQQQTGPTPLLLKNGMTLASQVQPVYFWDNGSDRIYERGNKIDPAKTTVLLQPSSRGDASQIKPFAPLYGTQLYDAKYRYLISPALAKDAKTFFIIADWDQIASEGMNSLRLPYSGSYGFVATVTFRRLSHGVSPAALALDCMDCHGKKNRLPWRDLGYDQDPWREKDPEPGKAP